MISASVNAVAPPTISKSPYRYKGDQHDRLGCINQISSRRKDTIEVGLGASNVERHVEEVLWLMGDLMDSRTSCAAARIPVLEIQQPKWEEVLPFVSDQKE
nr:hypothetical protein Iba_chr06cCG11900 [Ipomoea batatas]GMD09504.1 hypothetical protein Iba_chr06dCG8800 [Ipomoea batatas]